MSDRGVVAAGKDGGEGVSLYPSTEFVPPTIPSDPGSEPPASSAPAPRFASVSPHPKGRVVAVANQKGGVGKTTTAVNLSAAMAEMGQRVLVVDLDPQGNASTGLGIPPDRRAGSTYRVLAGQLDAAQAVLPTEMEGLFAIPATIDLAGAEIELVSQFAREARLSKALDPIRQEFDVIVLDCPPSLGLLTVNALVAAQELLVPIQCEYFALEGLGQLMRNVRLVQQNVNPALVLTGILLTMFDPRTKLAEEVVAEVRAFFGPSVYETIIPRSVRLSEAPGYGLPITRYDSHSKGAEAYRALAKEVITRPVVDGFVGADRAPAASVPDEAAPHEAAGPAAPQQEVPAGQDPGHGLTGAMDQRPAPPDDQEPSDGDGGDQEPNPPQEPNQPQGPDRADLVELIETPATPPQRPVVARPVRAPRPHRTVGLPKGAEWIDDVWTTAAPKAARREGDG